MASMRPNISLLGVGVRVCGVCAKIGLSLRFIDWFSDRGNAYEHNMRALDGHLGKIASLSLPAQRTPYGSQVRFDPSAPPLTTGPSASQAGGRGAGPGDVGLGR